MFFDSYKPYGDILGRDADDLPDLLVGEILQPEEDDGPVEGPQLADPLPEEADLPGFFVPVVEQIDVERQGLLSPCFFFRSKEMQVFRLTFQIQVFSALSPRKVPEPCQRWMRISWKRSATSSRSVENI